MSDLRIEPLTAVTGYRLSGELDLFTVGAARAVLEAEQEGTLVLDLSALEFVDDSGLWLLVWTYKRLRENKGSLVLRRPAGPVMRALELTGIAELSHLTVERG